VATLDCLLKNDIIVVLGLANKNVMGDDPAGSSKIYVQEPAEECDWPIAAFSFYKSFKFNPKSEMNVILEEQPAIDIGGVRRTFFQLYTRRWFQDTFNMFEGLCTHIHPTLKISVLNSGILKIFGQMIDNTLLMDGMGFPYFSPANYYYMAGKWNTAITYITEDVSSRV